MEWTVDGVTIVSELGVRMPDAEIVKIIQQLVTAKQSLGLTRDNITWLLIRKVSRWQRCWRRLTRYPIINCLRCQTPLSMICVAFLNTDDEEQYYLDLMGWCPKCRLLHFAAIPDDSSPRD